MDSAAIKTTVGYMGSWATQVGENSAFGPGDWISGTSGGSAGGQDGTLRNMQLRMFDDDGNKVSYYTPRFEGFQIGVSYTPEARQNTFTGTGGAPTPVPGGACTGSELCNTTKGAYHDFMSIGGNFDRKFGDLGVGIAAGFVTAKSPGRTNTATVNNTDDAMTYGFGVALEWGPFKISGGYRENKDVFEGAPGLQGSGATSLEGELYDIGARYTFGPNAVSASYRSGSVDGLLTDTAEQEEEAFMISFRRILGPGVNWDANLFWAEQKGEQGSTTAGTKKDNDGWALTTAIQLAF
jgi:predicted porin